MKNKPFSKEELKVLDGNLHKIAKKHRVSRQYVWQIATGIRTATSRKSQAIMKDLVRLLYALKQVL